MDSGGEFDNFSLFLFFICVDGDLDFEMLFDLFFLEDECVLLEWCIIGFLWWFLDLLSICLIFLDELVDNLIKDLEDMDLGDEMCFECDLFERNFFEIFFFWKRGDFKIMILFSDVKNWVSFD